LEWAAEQELAERSGLGWWIACLLPLVLHAWLRDLWAPDEPRYAEVAREMVDRGQWFVMHRCGELYPDKPPLFFWCAGLCGMLFGWAELALRLPSLLALAGLAWLTRRFALRFFSHREAELAPCLLLGFILVADIGGRAQIDPLFAFLCVLALELLTVPLRSSRGALWCCLAAGVCLAAALWTKGPVAFVNTGLPLALGLWFARDRDSALVRARGFGALALLTGCATVGLPLSVSLRAEPALGQHWLYQQHVARVTETGQHWGPPFEPLAELPLWLLPWSALVAFGVWVAARSWTRRADPDHQGLVFTGLWLVSLVLFYSLIPPKRPLYLLPAYPAAALLAAHAWADGERRQRVPGWVAWTAPLAMLLLGLLLCAAGLPVVLGLLPLSDFEGLGLGVSLGRAWFSCALPGLVLLAGGAWSMQALSSGRWRGALHAAIGGWTAGLCVAAICLCPLVNKVKSARGLSLWVARRAERPSEVPCVGVMPESYRYYGGFPAVGRSAEDLLPVLERDGPDFLALVRDLDYEDLAPALRSRLVVLHEDRVGTRRILVVARREPPVLSR
jgi:4-amino-4-deoxy-L-arabinose transferase-like glycosyltransferase